MTIPMNHCRWIADPAAGLLWRSWGDAHFAGKETAAIIAPENSASIRLAEKLGFVKKLETIYKGAPTLIFHRTPRS